MAWGTPRAAGGHRGGSRDGRDHVGPKRSRRGAGIQYAARTRRHADSMGRGPHAAVPRTCPGGCGSSRPDLIPLGFPPVHVADGFLDSGSGAGG